GPDSARPAARRSAVAGSGSHRSRRIHLHVHLVLDPARDRRQPRRDARQSRAAFAQPQADAIEDPRLFVGSARQLDDHRLAAVHHARAAERRELALYIDAFLFPWRQHAACRGGRLSHPRHRRAGQARELRDMSGLVSTMMGWGGDNLMSGILMALMLGAMVV